jgi:hypothetical protein
MSIINLPPGTQISTKTGGTSKIPDLTVGSQPGNVMSFNSIDGTSKEN